MVSSYTSTKQQSGHYGQGC